MVSFVVAVTRKRGSKSYWYITRILLSHQWLAPSYCMTKMFLRATPLIFIGFHLNLFLSKSTDCLGKWIASHFCTSSVITVLRDLSLEYAQFEQPKTVEITLYCPGNYYMYPQLTVKLGHEVNNLLKVQWCYFRKDDKRRREWHLNKADRMKRSYS